MNILRSLSVYYSCKFRYQSGLLYSHLLLDRLVIGYHPLLDTEDFDIHWISERSFRDALTVQVPPGVNPREGVPQLCFPDLLA
jgi:hypothetical protein